MKKLSFLLALSLIAFIAPFNFAHASEMQAGKIISIPATQTLSENAYLAGAQVNVSAPATKDLVVAGARVIVSAPVSGDLLILGGNVDVVGKVAGDVRIAGGNITLTEPVSGDVIVAGGTVTLLPGATVVGDLLVLGGSADVQGTVQGKVTIYASDVTLNAGVTGPVSIHAGKAVTFGASTALGNSLTYSAPTEATIDDGAKLGDQVVFTKYEGTSKHERSMVAGALAFVGIAMFIKFIGILLVALILTLAFKKSSLVLVTGAVQKFWKMVGIGFLATVATPVAILLLLITVAGAYLAFIVASLYLFALLVAGVFMCLIAGAFLSKWFRKEIRLDWKWTLGGVAVVFIAPFIPVIGWIALLLLFFAAMGAVVMSLKREAEVKMDS